MIDYFRLDDNGLPYADTHIPYCNCRGEDNLSNSTRFRQNRLSLYSCVPFARVSRAFDPKSSFLREREDPDHLDYLICRGEEPLAAILLETDDYDRAFTSSDAIPALEWDEKRAFLPVLRIRESAMIRGSVTPLLDALVKVILAPDRTRYKYPIHALTQAEFQRLQTPSKGLLFLSGNSTYITGYGREQGLFRGRFSAVNHRICAFPQDLETIEQSEFLKALPYSEAVTFAQRKERALKGMPCNRDNIVKAIRAFGQMPLREYLREFPDGLRHFENALGEDATFQDAARYVAAQMRKEQPGVCSFNNAFTPGKRLMLYLASPITTRRM